MLQLTNQGFALGSEQPQQDTQFHALHPARRGQTSVGSVNSVNNLLADSIHLVHHLGNGGHLQWCPPRDQWAAAFNDEVGGYCYLQYADTPWAAAQKLVQALAECGVEPTPQSGVAWTINTITKSLPPAATLDRFPRPCGNCDVGFTGPDVHPVNPPLR